MWTNLNTHIHTQITPVTTVVSTAQPYVAIDWDPDMKKRFYNENEAEVIFTECCCCCVVIQFNQ